MPRSFAGFEKTLFRRLNAVVEPAVRNGVGSPFLAPASLIVLESIGFKSGKKRRTPLWSLGFGPYRVVSTARAERSFWVKNLINEPSVSFYLGGRRRSAQAFVIADGEVHGDTGFLSPALFKLVDVFSDYALKGWVFALLIPSKP